MINVWRYLMLLWAVGVTALAGSEHWSLRPLAQFAPPPVQAIDWCRTPVDRFIVSRLEGQGMHPSSIEDKRTLIRRAFFDLLGLPPTPAELKSFLADSSSESFERVLDQLLERPEYGERWARHWLDVAHYAETHGHDQDRPRTNSWPYRDYVIASFNADKPYSRFVEEQIAGDALFPDDPQATVAMGFLATGPWDESSLRDIREDSIDRQIARYIDRDDVVSTVMNTFVSTTVQCARCHDHKFDPVSQREYYNLQAVFAGTEKGNRVYDPDPGTHTKRQSLLKEKKEIQKPDALFLAEVFAIHPFLPGRSVILETALANGSSCLTLPLYAAQSKIDKELNALPPPHLVYAGAFDFVPDASFKPIGKLREVRLLKRGDINKPGDPAVPGALDCIPGLTGKFDCDPSEKARRAALARWITDPRNALTWRSIVNRVWQYHFGRGLVNTPNDFGKMGGQPSHPELLDWLANWFLENGGSMKKLHKLIMTSAVYQQSSGAKPSYSANDSENVFLWRMNRMRLDAESIRDTILFITGTLDGKMGGPSAQQFLMSPGIHVTPKVDYTGFDMDCADARRRSIYRFVFRTLPDPFMDSLDCPDSSQLTATRNTSITASQALAMLNDQFVTRYSEHFAEGLERDCPRDSDAQLRRAVELTFGRNARPDELTQFCRFVEKNGLANFCRVLFNSNEFMFIN